MDVQRERPTIVYCVCRLRNANGSHDSCACTTDGPDQPVCRFCEAANHHRMPEFDPIIKGGPHAGTRVRLI